MSKNKKIKDSQRMAMLYEPEPFISEKAMVNLCDGIRTNFDSERAAIINFSENSHLPAGAYLPTGESIIKIRCKGADETDWIYINEDERLDTTAYISKINSFMRAFWNYKPGNTDGYINELEELFVAAMCNRKACDDDKAVLICFKNGMLSDNIIERNSDSEAFEAVEAHIAEIAENKRNAHFRCPKNNDTRRFEHKTNITNRRSYFYEY